MRLESMKPQIKLRNCWGDWGRIIAIEDDVAYLLMDDPEAVVDGDGETGVEILLLKDIQA